MRQRRDSTAIFYDILYSARRGATKKRIRQQLGMNSQQWEIRVSFLLSKSLLRESYDAGLRRYHPTMNGYRLFYYMSKIDDAVGGFSPHRQGFDRNQSIVLEKELTERLFTIPHRPTPARYPYTDEQWKVPA